MTLPEHGPFSIDVEQYIQDLQVNLTSAYASLHAAVAGWQHLARDEPKVFIATGNVVPFQPNAVGTTLGSGKAGLAHLIETGQVGYEKEGYK